LPLEVVAPPDDGVWRVGRAPDPLAPPDRLPQSALDQPTTGNRFDSPTGAYRVLYFATTLEGCFGETLARFRPDPSMLALVQDEWSQRGFMRVGDVPSDWRQRRIAVHVRFPPEPPFSRGVRFLDVESLETREVLRAELAPLLAFYKLTDLDVAAVRGSDRRITRWIGQWAYDARNDDGSPRFGGIRYLSRLNTDWECWAVFHDVPIAELDRRPILRADEALLSVAAHYGLTAH
jgi:hypothetical protein